LANSPHGGVQVVGRRAEQGDRFLDVAPGGGDADLEAGGEASVGVAVAQVGQGEQRLPAGVRPPPSGFALLAVAAMRSARWFRVRLDNEIVDG
jgi:hypothetical protein